MTEQSTPQDRPAYFERYECARLERDAAGVLTVTLHTEGESLEWTALSHRLLPRLFEDIGNDHVNNIVILTGAGENFIGSMDFGREGEIPTWFAGRRNREARRMLYGILDIDVPLIAALNGPCRIHSEIPLLCDIIVGCPKTTFQDAPHYTKGLIPGDGVHIVWPAVLGPNRGRYFLLMGEEIGAQEALRLGVLHEIVERDRLLPRAFEIAAKLLEAPALARRFTSTAIRAPIRNLLRRDLELGLAIEGMSALDYWPTGWAGVPRTPNGE